MKERNMLAVNIAVAKQAELNMERQRLAMGQVTMMRRPFIDKMYAHAIGRGHGKK